MDALDLLDHRLGAAAQHGTALNRRVERQGAALVQTALPAVAALLVLEVARLLQHDALRSLQSAHQYLVEVLRSLLQVAPRLLVGFGDAGVHTDEDVLGSRFPAIRPCRLPVDADALLSARQIGEQHHAHRRAHLGRELRRVRVARRDHQGWMRFLQRFGPDRNLTVLEMLAFPAEGLGLGPGLEDQLHRLALALPGFAGRDVVGKVLVRDAAHQPGDQPPAAHAVEHRVFLGDADRIVERHEIADHRDFHSLRGISEGPADKIAVGHHPVRAEVVLVAPDPVEAATLRVDHAVDVRSVERARPLRVEVAVGKRPVVRFQLQMRVRHQVEKGEFHPGFSVSSVEAPRYRTERITRKGRPLQLPGQRSFTGIVPASVPLLVHSSRPVTPSLAEKYNAPLKTVRAFGAEPAPEAVLMSFTRTVPASVPSLFHSSGPLTPSSAEKYNAAPKTVSSDTREPVLGLMSFTRTVPPSVPSVLHSSGPVTPSSAEKYKALPNSTKRNGSLPPRPGLMSFTRTVPPSVPSLLHSSMPVTPSLAAKYKALPNTLKPEGEESAAGLMFFTSAVPPAVPSVFHSSHPVAPSSAEKYIRLLNTVNPLGEALAPGFALMSFTCTVPPSVPSVFHSSRPLTPSSAEKYNALLNTVKPFGEELKGARIPPMDPTPGAMSFTRTVPPSVPSVFHSSAPVPPSLAEKYNALLNTVKPLGEEPGLGLMSFTRTVPASVPSLFHSSGPVTPSAAEKNQAPLKKTNSEGKRVPPSPGKEWSVAVVLMSFTRTVPVPVPSVFHSSIPLTPSLAARTKKAGAGTGVELTLPAPPLEQPKTLFGGGGGAGAELVLLLAPPPQPASPNADASARALVARYNSVTRLSRRIIGAPCLRPAAPLPSTPAVPVEGSYVPRCRVLGSISRRGLSPLGAFRGSSPHPAMLGALARAGVLPGLEERPVPLLELSRLLL